MALLALGCVLSLLAPNQSWASSLVARHGTDAGSPQWHHARDAQVPPHTAVAAPSRPDVRSTADGASVLVLLVLTLNSAVMRHPCGELSTELDEGLSRQMFASILSVAHNLGYAARATCRGARFSLWNAAGAIS